MSRRPRIERYGSNAEDSVPVDIMSPMQAGQREMLDSDVKRELEKYPVERVGEDAHDRHEAIITPEALGDKAEIELSRDERNPYLQGIAVPTTCFVCPICRRLTAREGIPGDPTIAPPHTHEFTVEED